MANFGAAVDIDLLEQEVYNSGAHHDDLSGTISSMPSSRPARRTPMQEVDLETEFDTLDEPVIDTIMRDVKTVGSKFGYVIFPRSSKKHHLLKDWDLWGPLFICVALSLLLHSSGSGEAAPQFTQVFSLTFFGSCIVTLNIKLLGGQISFFQSLCVIGYCLLPPSLSAIFCTILNGKLFMLRVLLSGLGFIWATYAATGFLADSQPPKRRLLVVYPIFMFYFVVSWLILSHS